MLEYLDDIESDLSRFHRIDNPMKLSSSRYFKLAERLVFYQGVVRTKVQIKVEEDQPPERDALSARSRATPVSLETMLAESDSSGSVPGIEYSGG